MASVFGRISIRLRDYLHVEATPLWLFECDDEMSVGLLLSSVMDKVADLEQITGARVVSVDTAFWQAPRFEWKQTPIDGDEVERTAILEFLATNNRSHEGLIVPAILAEAVQNGRVDLENAGIQSFAYMVVNDWNSVALTDHGNRTFLDLTSARLATRRKRKPLSRRSYEEG